MRFECGDLERALAVSDLMPEAREHLKTCAACRREYRLWNEISSSARELHHDWESTELWPRIHRAIEAEPKLPAPRWRQMKTWTIAAALAVAVLIPFTLLHRPDTPSSNISAPNSQGSAANHDFLTDQALREVEQNEAAYRKSIEKLSSLAQPKLQNASSPANVNAREKLLLLDSAIADTRSSIASNRFNVSLQNTLADLYREKQQTLQELLSRDRTN